MELVNTHCHCVYSGHGAGSVAEYADAAAAAGLTTLAFTEHFPLSAAFDPDEYLSMTAANLPRYLAEIEAARAAQLIGRGEGASGHGARHGGKRARSVLEGGGAYVEVQLREGRKRQVRRMLQAVDHPVIALHRAALGPLDLGGLPRGQARALTESELAALRAAVG